MYPKKKKTRITIEYITTSHGLILSSVKQIIKIHIYWKMLNLTRITHQDSPKNVISHMIEKNRTLFRFLIRNGRVSIVHFTQQNFHNK